MYFWLLSSKLISHLSDPVCWKGFLYSCCFQILPTYCTLHELRFQHGPQREQTSAFVSKWAKREVKSTFSKPEISTSGEVRMLFFPPNIHPVVNCDLVLTVRLQSSAVTSWSVSGKTFRRHCLQSSLSTWTTHQTFFATTSPTSQKSKSSCRIAVLTQRRRFGVHHRGTRIEKHNWNQASSKSKNKSCAEKRK